VKRQKQTTINEYLCSQYISDVQTCVASQVFI